MKTPKPETIKLCEGSWKEGGFNSQEELHERICEVLRSRGYSDERIGSMIVAGFDMRRVGKDGLFTLGDRNLLLGAMPMRAWLARIPMSLTYPTPLDRATDEFLDEDLFDEDVADQPHTKPTLAVCNPEALDENDEVYAFRRGQTLYTAAALPVRLTVAS